VPQTLWDDWCGTPRFYQDPVWPYVLALLYRVFGTNALWGILFNLVLGVATNLVIGLLAWRLFGGSVGVLAAALAILCGAIHVFDFTLLRDSGVILLSALLPLLAIQLRDRPTQGRALILGACWGIGIGLKSTFLLFLPGILWSLWPSSSKARGEQLRSSGMVAIGLLLIGVPWVARDLALGISPGLSRSAAINFVQGNSVSSGPANWFFSVQDMSGIFAASMEKGLLPVVWSTLETHRSLGSIVSLYASKFLAIVNWIEIPNNVNLYYFAGYSPVLRLAGVNWSVIFPLALVGGALCVRRRVTGIAPLLIMAGAIFLALFGFLVFARFRSSLEALLIPFAAYGTVEVWACLRKKQWRPASLLLGLWAAAMIAALWNYTETRNWRVVASDYVAGAQVYVLPRWQEAAASGNWAAAKAIADGGLRVEPGWLRERSAVPAESYVEEDRILFEVFGVFHQMKAEACRNLGEIPAAEAEAGIGKRYQALAAE
jgi:4-amino-4-deoxy-L-arabinose transferase-like glycosyltransferase